MPKTLLLILTLLMMPVFCPAQLPERSGPAGWVNAVLDCHLRGDGVTDDLAAFNACRDAHPGATILFPKTRPAGKPDYFFSDSLVPKGNGMVLEGATGPGWGNGVKLKFAAHRTGIHFVESLCAQCTARNLVLEGSEAYDTSTPSQNILPCSPGDNVKYAPGVICAKTGDGILVNANFTNLEHLYITAFGRHGVNADSTGAEGEHWADNLMANDVTANGNRGNGFYFHGGDTNAGSLMQAHAYVNQLYGFVLDDFLGNALYSPEAHTNHQHGTSHGYGSSSISEISTAQGIVIVAHSGGINPEVGNSVTISGTNKFNGAYFVSTVADAHHFSFARAGDAAGEHSGKVEFASNDEHFAAAGVSGGGYFSNALNVDRVLVMPYCESDQDPAVLPSKVVILGGDMGCGVGQATVLDPETLRNVFFIKQNGSDYGRQGFTFQAGKTKDVEFNLQYKKFNDSGVPGNTYFMQWFSPPDAYDRFALVDGNWTESAIPRLLIQGLGGGSANRKKNGDTTLSARGTGKIVLNGSPGFYPNEGTGTGGVHFQSGGQTPADVAVIDNAGKATFNGGVSTTRLAGGFVEVPFSAAPIFDAARGNTFKLTLTADATRSTLENASPGQQLNFIVCQDAAANHSFSWPSNVKGGSPVGTNPGKCLGQSFLFDGKNAYATGVGVADE